MPLGVAVDNMKSRQRGGNPQDQDRKNEKRMMTLVNPEGKEVEVTIANAHDLLAHVPGWKRPQAPDHVQNPYAHAPRRKRDPLSSHASTTQQANVDAPPTGVAAQAGRGTKELSPMQKAAKAAVSSLETDNNGPTADEMGDDLGEMEATVDAELKKSGVELPKANEVAFTTRKQRAAKNTKSKEDDAEVVTKLAGNVKDDIAKELAEKDRLFAELE